MRSLLDAFKLSYCLPALALAACGGGGGGGAASVMPAVTSPAGGVSAGAAMAPVSFSVAIPAVSTSSVRRLRYVSAATKSVAIAVGAARQTADCTSTCSVTLQAPVGNVTFTAALYDGPGGTGNVLATGTTTSAVVDGQANSVKISFGGVVSTIALALAQTSVTAGTPSAVALTVSARDAAGFTIVGPEPYAAPITLADDDTSGATSLSTSSIAAPGLPVTLSYTGKAGIAAAHISAAVAGTAIAPAAVTLSVQVPAAVPAGGVPSHASTWHYFGLNQVNQTIPAAWMAAHVDYVEDDGTSAEHAQAFKDAGGKYAVAYTDPAYVPYCVPPFTPPSGSCAGPIGNHITDEGAWFHGPDGSRIRHYVDAEFQYQEALNPASQSARDAYTWYTQRLISRAPKVDFFLADDMGGTFLGPDGTALSGAFYGFNASAVEITTTSAFQAANQQMFAAAARPVLVNGYDVQTRLPSYGGLWIDSPNVVGDLYEGCYSDGRGVAGDASGKWAGQSNGLLLVIAHRSRALCMMTADSTPANRIYMMASWWMTYTEPYSIAAPEVPTADGFTVVPEYDIVPRSPRTTATTDVRALRSATGAYVREFAACYQAGTAIGPCAAVVNTSASPEAMPALAGTYAHALAVDDKSAYTGGTASWTGAVPSQLAPLSAVILR